MAEGIVYRFEIQAWKIRIYLILLSIYDDLPAALYTTEIRLYSPQ